MLPRTDFQSRGRRTCLLAALGLFGALFAVWSAAAAAQDDAAPTDSQGPVAEFEDREGAPVGEPTSPPPVAPEKSKGMNLLKMLVSGGVLMLPIAAMSLIAIAMTIERFLGLRRERVLPSGLVTGLARLGGPKGNFDPRQAYRVCQQFPSAASAVVRAMLFKVGRPHSEVEHAVGEASQREAERLHSNVRWLTLSAGVSPLLGLFGTVWGMINAFHRTTLLPPGVNKAEYLASGIYVALVTTLGGLAVAIPSAILAHYFEGRIQGLFHQIDELVFNLMPQIERFEGRVRFGQWNEDGTGRPQDESRTSDGTPSPRPVRSVE